MRELLLKLLTYEPFEKISRNEKKYIDAVLTGNYASRQYPLYEDLMNAFKQYVDSGNWENRQVLVTWFNNYYSLPKSSITKDFLRYKSNNTRTYYPVLFKKICIYSILGMQLAKNTRNNASNAQFFKDFGMRENILNKWNVSTRYLFLANRNTYSSFKIDRNGVKKPYLTRVVKKVYYESANQLRKFPDTAKQYEMETFVDIFAGTGTVAASVDAKNVIVNDVDAGTASFLFAFVNYKREVKKTLADFHREFVSENLRGKELYSDKNVQEHYETYVHSRKSINKAVGIKALYDKQYYDDNKPVIEENEIKLGECNIGIHREFIKNIRNNYQGMKLALENWNEAYNYDLSTLPADFDFSQKTADPNWQKISDIIEYGVMWFFFWSIDKSNAGHEPAIVDMSESAYAKYITEVLGFDFKNTANYQKYSKSRIDKMYVAKYFVERMILRAKNISFGFDNTHNFFKYMKNAKVYNLSYEKLFDVLNKKDGKYFYYLDSPYFLTTDYKVPFRDKEHKEMLDILRAASFHWLFSMQYYEGSTKKVKKVARPSLKKYKPQIRNYDSYYKGFVNEFIEDETGYWVVGDNLDKEKMDKLYVILFSETLSNEMMICNFDVRAAIKYGDAAAVLPMREFIKLEQQSGMQYETIYRYAVEWRRGEIEKNYASSRTCV